MLLSVRFSSVSLHNDNFSPIMSLFFGGRATEGVCGVEMSENLRALFWAVLKVLIERKNRGYMAGGELAPIPAGTPQGSHATNTLFQLFLDEISVSFQESTVKILHNGIRYSSENACLCLQ